MGLRKAKTISIYEPVTILGHTFQNLQEIDDAVKVLSSKGDVRLQGRRLAYKPYFSLIAPRTWIQGVHVLKIYKPYPCFDESDFAYESRVYHSYFFCDRMFTKEDVFRLSKLKYQGGCHLVADDVPWGYSYVYHNGSDDTMEVVI